MKLFRVCATVGYTTPDGYWRTQQCPTFLLDGEMHGIKTDEEAEQFAERWLKDLYHESQEAQAHASACDHEEYNVQRTVRGTPAVMGSRHGDRTTVNYDTYQPGIVVFCRDCYYVFEMVGRIWCYRKETYWRNPEELK